MFDVAQKLLRYAKNSGADQSEIYLTKSTEHEIRTSKMKLEGVKQATTLGIALRVLCGKKLGLAYTSDSSESSLKSIAARAVELARATTEDEYIDFQDPPKEYPNISILDRSLGNISIEEKIDLVLSMEKAAFDCDKRIVGSDYVSYNDAISEVCITNSKGLMVNYTESAISIGGAFVAEEDGFKQMGWERQTERYWERLNPSRVGVKAAERAILTLKGKPVPSGVYPVVLEPLVAIKFIYGIANAVNGESVRLKKSFLCDKKDEEVASKLVTMIDDGTKENWVDSSPVDDEGSPTMAKEVLKEGVLLNFLYDIYTARKVDANTTGNARRASYGVNPAISPTNFFLLPGKYKKENMIGEISDGLLVTGSIGFRVNSITGDFSIGASGRWIRGGKLAQPVSGVTIASNLAEMLKAVDAVGDDLVPVYGGVGTPTIRLSRITIAGE